MTSQLKIDLVHDIRVSLQVISNVHKILDKKSFRQRNLLVMAENRVKLIIGLLSQLQEKE
jgi:hypothetical protein